MKKLKQFLLENNAIAILDNLYEETFETWYDEEQCSSCDIFEQYKENFIEENPEYKNTHKIITDTDDFKEYIKEHIFDDRYDDFYNTIDEILRGNNGKIPIYRQMTVPQINEFLDNLSKNKKSSLGVYWSWDESSAEAHWGEFGKQHDVVTISSSIDINKVNWKETALANMRTPEEREITLPENTELYILAMFDEKKDRELEIGSLTKKRFWA